MRRRTVVRAGISILACSALLTPGAGAATPAPEENLQGYLATIDADGMSRLGDQGIDSGQVGFHRRTRTRSRSTSPPPDPGKALEADGIDLEPAPAYTGARERPPRRGHPPGPGVAKPETGGDSPNTFYDVFRTYSEPGGIADELRALAAKTRRIEARPDRHLPRGKPILASRSPQRPQHAQRRGPPSSSGVNHAREWIAAETARRMPTWFPARDAGATKEIVDAPSCGSCRS